jgi:NAD(P)-dependent dehydrogenase (short-subunit alcohol dehydrogenase family)/uncharacterized protein (DUF1330 family)
MREFRMSAYVIVEFTVKDPDVYRDQYSATAGRTAKEHGGEVVAAGKWEVLHGDGSLTSGALVRFADREGIRVSAREGKTVLITGANAGIGKEVARQLALRADVARIYLAGRNHDRVRTAKAELEAATGRSIFEIVVMDVADLGSVRAGLAAIEGSVDALVMNAGVIGPQSMGLTADGVTTSFATNVLGHVVLLEGLLAEGRLGEVAVFAGSEAVRGVPKLRMKGPSFVSTSADELATVIDGSYFAGRRPDFNLAFGQAKYIGALWMAHLARQHPDRRFITVSPGNTTGTQVTGNLPLPMRIAAKYVMPTLGLAHKLEVGAKRLVDAVTDPTLSSGVFYASAANKLTGPLVNQADFLPDLANPSFQDHADEAIHRFIS